jgi:hypothetical protein
MWKWAMDYATMVHSLFVEEGRTISRHQAFYGDVPNLTLLRPFGAVAWAHVPKPLRTKLENKAVKGVLVGYEPPFGSRTYRILINGKVTVSCDVVFPMGMSTDQTGIKGGEGMDASLTLERGEESSIQTRVSLVPTVDKTLPDSSLTVLNKVSSTPVHELHSGAIPTLDTFITDEEEDDGPEYTLNTHPAAMVANIVCQVKPNMMSDLIVQSKPLALSKEYKQASLSTAIIPYKPPSVALASRLPDMRHIQAIGEYVSDLPFALRAEAPVHGFGPDPNSVREALSRPDADKWQAAIDSEMDSLLSHGSWTVVALPPGKHAIGSRFVLTRKRDGRYKARLVAQGFSQRPGIDYGDTYAPVSRYATFRALIGVATGKKMHMRQLDIKTAFLYGEIIEEVYMKLPPGYESMAPPGYVCRLIKAVYGLKQAPRAWHVTLAEQLRSKGFRPSAADPSFYFCDTKRGRTFILVYVDDCIIAAEAQEDADEVCQHIKSLFEAHDIGEPTDYCGIIIKRDQAAGISQLHQTPYILQLLASWDMADCEPQSTPQPPTPLVATGINLSEELTTAYPSLVGSVMHLANCTRPDIAQAVSKLARYLKKPTTLHWGAALHLLQYLKGTSHLALTYGQSQGLKGYCDSVHEVDADTKRSGSSFIFTINGGAFTWQSRLQPTLSKTPREAHYQTASLAAREALWTRFLLQDLGISVTCVQVQCAHPALLEIEKTEDAADLPKHISVIHHFLLERMLDKQLSFILPSSLNVAKSLAQHISDQDLPLHLKTMGLQSEDQVPMHSLLKLD